MSRACGTIHVCCQLLMPNALSMHVTTTLLMPAANYSYIFCKIK